MNSSIPIEHPERPALTLLARQTLEPTSDERLYLGTPWLNGHVPPKSKSYDPEEDVKAIKGMRHARGGTLIKVLTGKSSRQMQILARSLRRTGVDVAQGLVQTNQDTLRFGLSLLAEGAVAGDALLLKQIRRAGWRHMSLALTEVIAGRTKEELTLLDAYLRKHDHISLEDLVLDHIATHHPFMRAVLRQCLNLTTQNDTQDVHDEYRILERQLQGGFDTRVSAVLPKLLDRPPSHIQALHAMWKKAHGTRLVDVISDRFDLTDKERELFQYALTAARYEPEHRCRIELDAFRINEAVERRCKTMLTIRLVRAHWHRERWKLVVQAVDSMKEEKQTSLLERIRQFQRSILNPFGASARLVYLWEQLVEQGQS